ARARRHVVPVFDPQRTADRARDGAPLRMAVTAAVTWDLSPLYRAPDDPRIADDLAAVGHDAEAFGRTHRGHVATLAGEDLARAIDAYEAIEVAARRPAFYAHMLFAADTGDDGARRLVD